MVRLRVLTLLLASNRLPQTRLRTYRNCRLSSARCATGFFLEVRKNVHPSATIPREGRDLDTSKQDGLYEQAAAEYRGAVARLARAYEADVDKRAELRQEIHIALWRSFAVFDGRCSLSTWVYRVAHNTAATHVIKSKRAKANGFVSLDDLEVEPANITVDTDRELALERLAKLIRRLKPIDRLVISLYLECEDGASIGEITGLAAGNVAVKIHRIKAVLARQFEQGERRAEQADSQ